jgi:hypothetical protein
MPHKHASQTSCQSVVKGDGDHGDDFPKPQTFGGSLRLDRHHRKAAAAEFELTEGRALGHDGAELPGT